MYCDQCGTAVKPTSKFCHSCGHQLQALVTQPVSTQTSADCHIKEIAEVITSSEESAGAQLNGVVQLNSGTPEIHQESSVESSGVPSLFLGAHHPWPRFFARITDMALAAPLLYLSLFYPIGEYPFIEFLLGTYGAASLIDNTWFIAVIVFVLWVPIEAFFLSAFGATFGKWLFGIRVLNSVGNKLSYGNAFLRSCKVLMFGMVLNLPIINMIACLLSYIKLVKTGSTVWDGGADANGTLLVSHRPWSLVRGLICAFTIIVVLVGGALTPVVVAKLNNNYWAGRGKSPTLANSAKVETTSAEQAQAPMDPSLSGAEDIVNGEEKRRLEVAANQGDAVAQYAMGKLSFREGSHKEAARWLHLSAGQGNAKARDHLGNLYYSGLGVPKDTKEAVRLYRLAAAQGVAGANYSLGMAYHDGEGVPRNKVTSLRYFGLAADQGYRSAFHELGNYYWDHSYQQTDERLRRNVVAYALFNHCCSLQPESRLSCGSRDLVKANMSRSQLEIGQALTRDIAQGWPTQEIVRYLKSAPVPK